MFSTKHFLFSSRLGWLIYYILNYLAFQILYKTKYYQIIFVFFLVGLGAYIVYICVFQKPNIVTKKIIFKDIFIVLLCYLVHCINN